jgi:hypothetical protein
MMSPSGTRILREAVVATIAMTIGSKMKHIAIVLSAPGHDAGDQNVCGRQGQEQQPSSKDLPAGARRTNSLGMVDREYALEDQIARDERRHVSKWHVNRDQGDLS